MSTKHNLENESQNNSVKRLKSQELAFHCELISGVPQSLIEGMELSKAILLNASFKNAFYQVVQSIADISDTDKPKRIVGQVNEYRTIYNKRYRAEMDQDFDSFLKSSFDLRLIKRRDAVVAFCCVYRLEFPRSIFFNPFLILDALECEKTNPSLKSSFTLFFAVKIVHEIAHLLHYELILKHMDRLKVTPAKTLVDQVTTYIKKKKQQQDREADYNDFGNMIERELFRGILEIKCQEGTFMDLEAVIFYPSILGLVGNKINSQDTIDNFMNGKMEISVGDEYQ